MTSIVLGLSADYHDSAAAVVIDGVPVAAAQEERFSRLKHDPTLPIEAMRWCLREAEVAPGDLAAVAFHGKPLTTYERIVESHGRAGPRAFPWFYRSLRSWFGRKLWIGYRIDRALAELGHPPADQHFVDHHLAHAASAYHPSPFERAAVLTVDGVGEWTTTSISRGTPGDLEVLSEIRYPHSLGLLYSAVTAHCGFSVNDGESKLMGLAPYGSTRYEEVIRSEIVDLREDGSFGLNLRYFDLEGGTMFHPRVRDLLGGSARPPEADLSRREADLAASVQAVLEEAMIRLARRARELTGERDLCLAGGVALNCVANSRIRDSGIFDRVWVQPAAGDAGGALGAALWAAHELGEVSGGPDGDAGVGNRETMVGAALGPAFDEDEVADWLARCGVEATRHESLGAVAAMAADALAAGSIVGWFQGRMEFGPRALGRRSILADPRSSEVVGRINAKVKGREGFRPLAPAVLAEHAEHHFEIEGPSQYMLFTARVRGAVPAIDPPDSYDLAGLAARLAQVESPLPACTHVDGSARVQTVDVASAPELRTLLREFHARTGCPVLLNTSFNLADEPIVRSPADALDSAVRGGLDLLVIGCHTIGPSSLSRLRITP